MKLSKLLLFAVTVIGFQANATLPSPSNAACPHGKKDALVRNDEADSRKIDTVMGTRAPSAPKTNSSGTTARR